MKAVFERDRWFVWKARKPLVDLSKLNLKITSKITRILPAIPFFIEWTGFAPNWQALIWTLQANCMFFQTSVVDKTKLMVNFLLSKFYLRIPRWVFITWEIVWFQDEIGPLWICTVWSLSKRMLLSEKLYVSHRINLKNFQLNKLKRLHGADSNETYFLKTLH